MILSEEEEIFRQVVREFAEERLAPVAAKMDQEGKLDAQIIPWLFELGLMAIEIPEEQGGAGASFFMSVLAIEELARVDPSVAVVCDVQNTLFINAVRRWATEEQRQRFFRKLSSGTVGAYALSEAGSGSDAFALATRAERRGVALEREHPGEEPPEAGHEAAPGGPRAPGPAEPEQRQPDDDEEPPGEPGQHRADGVDRLGVARIAGELVTPPVSCGLLAGTFREELLSRGTICERVITVAELERSEELYLVNSVEQWMDAVLVR